MEAEQLLKLYQGKRRDFSWVDLRGAILNQAQLCQANFYQAKLMGAQLEGANLSHANLRKADLNEAVLTEACLQGTQLIKTNLSQAKLNGADLTGADLMGTQLVNADLSNANLSQAKLYRTNLSGAVLLGASIAVDDLAEADLTGAIMPDGSTYEEWRLLHQNQAATEVDGEKEIAEELPANLTFDSEVPEESNLPVIPKKPLTEEEMWKYLPFPSLALLLLGYIFFGQILETLQAGIIYWLLAWVGSVGWVAGESLTWFVPVSAAVAIFMALVGALSGMGGFFLMLMIIAPTFAVFSDLWFVGFGFGKSVRDSLWVGGLIVSFVLFYIFLLFGGSVGLGFSFVLGIVGSGFGAISWMQMEERGFSKNQTLPIFGGVTAFGLLSGWCFGQF
ncbi:MAG: pentapeptide repeat-containing protein [Calothrix sp. MO_192.B10]|nr:pentapeptide repeat-containing protein [Calothrix sp. MO_192.B10]